MCRKAGHSSFFIMRRAAVRKMSHHTTSAIRRLVFWDIQGLLSPVLHGPVLNHDLPDSQTCRTLRSLPRFWDPAQSGLRCPEPCQGPC